MIKHHQYIAREKKKVKKKEISLKICYKKDKNFNRGNGFANQISFFFCVLFQ